MPPEISSIATFVGFIAGFIFYLDSWSPSPAGRELKDTKRYRGLLVIVGTVGLTPLIDRYVLNEVEKLVFFKGYLFGACMGWLLFIGIGSLSYVVWKNTKHLQEGLLYRWGQINFSFLEVLSLGITENTQLKQETENQLAIADAQAEVVISQIREELKQNNPERFIELEEQDLEQQLKSLHQRKQELHVLKETVDKSNTQPDKEAAALIAENAKVIANIHQEIERTKQKTTDDPKELDKMITSYENNLLTQQEKQEQLVVQLEQYKRGHLPAQVLHRQVTNRRIQQYEKASGTILKELVVNQKIIKIYHGSVAHLTTDVIVSPADTHLSMVMGEALQIRKKGGETIYRAAQQLQPIAYGQTATTHAGDLPIKKVIHAAIYDIADKQTPTALVLRQVIRQSFALINQKEVAQQYNSIAFPLLGTDQGDFPLVKSLEILLEETAKALQQPTDTTLEVYIALSSKAVDVLDVPKVAKRIIG